MQKIQLCITNTFFFKYSKIETYFYIVLISDSITVFTVFLFKYNLDETFQKHKKNPTP